MDSLSSVKVSPSVVTNPLSPRRCRMPLSSSSLGSLHNRSLCRLSSSSSSSSVFGVPCPPYSRRRLVCRSGGGGGGGAAQEEDDDGDDDGSEQVERALHLDGNIPSSSDEFVKRVSSRAYDMRRHLHQTFDSGSYDVKLKRSLGKLFSKGGKWNQAKQPRNETKFQMLVEDIRDGVLVFEDENEAVRYCDLLQGGGKGCEGVAEIEASSVFDVCQKMRAFAVLFRRGISPPLPQSLELNLRARKRSLEDEQNA